MKILKVKLALSFEMVIRRSVSLGKSTVLLAGASLPAFLLPFRERIWGSALLGFRPLLTDIPFFPLASLLVWVMATAILLPPFEGLRPFFCTLRLCQRNCMSVMDATVSDPWLHDLVQRDKIQSDWRLL